MEHNETLIGHFLKTLGVSLGPHRTVGGGAFSYITCNVSEGREIWEGGCRSSRRIKLKCYHLAGCTALNQNSLLNAVQTTLADHLCGTKFINYGASTHFEQSVCANLSHLHVNAQHRWRCIIDKLSILYKCTQLRFLLPLIFVNRCCCRSSLLH